MMSAKKSFISGAVVLMISGLVVRLLGFVYRIYISNLLGSEGMGLFQLISPVYSLIILTLTSGVSIAVSKMTARETARRHFANIRRITLIALLAVFAAGTGISLLLLLNTGYIANSILKEPRTYYSILLLIPCIPVIALSSTLKGYFYGVQDVMPVAWSQIAEQVVRIGLVLFTAKQFLDKGLEYACAFATGAMATGEIASLLVLYIMYKPSIRKYIKDKSRKSPMRKRAILLEIFKVSLPVSSNRFITSVMSAVELILIPRRLLEGGMNYQESIELYGKLTGMAMPLIYFPCIVTSSLAITLVPAISEALSLKNFKTANYRISRSIQISFMLGFTFSAIFLSYPNEISSIIYRKENIAELLYLLAFTCLFTYLQQTLAGILNGLGKQGISLRNSVIGYIIRIGFVYFLLPVYGIRSYITAIFISSLLICALNLSTVIKATGMYIDIRNWILKPGAVGIFMLLVGKYIYSFFSIFIEHETLITVFSVAGNIIIGLLLMVTIGILEKEQILKMIGLKK
ncbi:MAG TPA: stage V sporulation protein B [Clostridiales bacterium]|nr:stage V sporulation protein B [Clostridiales bacterium]